MTDINIDELRQWTGRKESQSESIGPGPASRLAATLEHPDTEFEVGRDLPPLFHWIYFTPSHRRSALGQDGHAALGGFLPPIPLPRRMWASSKVEFISPLTIGNLATRESEIVRVALKAGRSGDLVFVTLQHTITSGERVAIRETQQLVYRKQTEPSETAVPASAAPQNSTAEIEIRPDPVLLFRYSALTFNSHRIHFDRDYAKTVEGYPGLVVQGPLVATLLANHLQLGLGATRLRTFEFRALCPLFDTESFFICWQRKADPNHFHLWSRDCRGALCTDASATLA